MDKDAVNIAFEMLLEEIERIIKDLRETGAEAFKKGEYDEASQVAGRATCLSSFRDKVRALREEWAQVFAPRAKASPRPRPGSRLSRGLCTPQDAYRRPLLEALVELGGSAPVPEVLNLVGAKMKRSLNDWDHQSLPGRGGVRWRNKVQWCRYGLVQEGLMKRDSPRGIWEISERGREALQSGQV